MISNKIDIIRPTKINFNLFILAMIVSSVIGVGISYGDIYLYHILFLCAFLFFLIKLKFSNYCLNLPTHLGNLHFFFLITFLWYLLSIIWAPSLSYAFNSIQKLNILFKALTFIFIIELIIALLESFTSFQMPISRYSELASIFGKTPQENFEYSASSLFFNTSPPTGFHWDTNDLALAMLLILPFFMVSNKISTKIIGITSIMTIIAMASSRSVFFGLILIFLVYFFVIKKKVTTILVVLGFASIVFLGIFQFQTSENPRLNELANSFEIIAL